MPPATMKGWLQITDLYGRFPDRPYKSIYRGGWCYQPPLQINFQKPQKKGQKIAIFFNPRRSPPAATHTLTLPLQHFFMIFAHFASAWFRTRNLSLMRKFLYRCTSRSLVSTFHFGSPHIIQN